MVRYHTGGPPSLRVVILLVLVSAVSVAGPVIYVLVGGESARRTLEGWRTWLTAHNAAVMTVLLVVIGAKLLGSGLDAFIP